MADAHIPDEGRTQRMAQLDPIPGDAVRKGRLTRRVVQRDGGDIWYVNQVGHRRNCWLSTWQHWTAAAQVTQVAHESQRGESHE